MSFLKPPKLVEKIENKKFLWLVWKKKTWYVEWEFCVLGPYNSHTEAYAEYAHAMYAYRMTNEA